MTLHVSFFSESLQCEMFNRDKFLAHYGLANTGIILETILKYWVYILTLILSNF